MHLYTEVIADLPAEWRDYKLVAFRSGSVPRQLKDTIFDFNMDKSTQLAKSAQRIVMSLLGLITTHQYLCSGLWDLIQCEL